MTDIRNQRIQALKNILLRLHHGASPESVQADFEAHFAGVSPIEVSLMEHELMNGDHGVGFEDVMKLCTVHARVMATGLETDHQEAIDQEGHPVWIFKQENLALQATLLRIHRLLDAITTLTPPIEQGLLKGLRRQFDQLQEFDRHYRRKEELFFPIMEAHGHDAPPKVMWGVDDQIRELFHLAYDGVKQLPKGHPQQIKEDFLHFEQEFKEMIFKEEAILLPLVLSLFTEDDWIAIAKDSPEFGYALIHPQQIWQPQYHAFTQKDTRPEKSPTSSSRAEEALSTEDPTTALPFQTEAPNLPFGGGYLTVKEANLILNHLPFEITFIDKDDLFKYFNTSIQLEQKLFPRVPSAIGRHVKNCHPPKSLDMVMTLIDDLKHRRRQSESMWFHRQDGRFAYVTYIGVFDEEDHYMGVLEYVHDIAPLLALGPDKRGLAPLNPPITKE